MFTFNEKINVILISQASSEHSICVAIETTTGLKAKAAIEREFQREIRDGLIDEVKITGKLSVIAVVGDGMKHQSGSSRSTTPASRIPSTAAPIETAQAG